MHKCRWCHRSFVPDPRVGDRQVTCGDAKCRRQQHAESCRRWREQNHDVTSRHYEDAVVPFRNLRRTYQREWRFLQSLREMRDEMGLALRGVARPLGRLIRRGQAISTARAAERRETGPGRRDPFVDAWRAVHRIAALMDDLAALIRQLEEKRER